MATCRFFQQTRPGSGSQKATPRTVPESELGEQKRDKAMQNDFSGIPLNEEFRVFMENEKSMGRMILQRAEQRGAKTAMRWFRNGNWQSWTCDQFRQQARAVAKSLIHIGIGEGDMVGIFSHNRPQWHIADVGICSTRAAAVPIYATNSAREP
mgnify:CR=1 FL=1